MIGITKLSTQSPTLPFIILSVVAISALTHTATAAPSFAGLWQSANVNAGEVQEFQDPFQRQPKAPHMDPPPISIPGDAQGGFNKSTVYGQQGLSYCQYSILVQLTSMFESSSTE